MQKHEKPQRIAAISTGELCNATGYSARRLRDLAKAGLFPPPQHVTYELLALIRDDVEALAMWREAMKGQEGGDKRSEATTCNNVTGDGAVTGNSRSYTLSRLSRQAPEL
jgi:hypothetical protein